MKINLIFDAYQNWYVIDISPKYFDKNRKTCLYLKSVNTGYVAFIYIPRMFLVFFDIVILRLERTNTKAKEKMHWKVSGITFVFKEKNFLAVNLYELTITKIIFPIEIGFSLCPLERKWNCQKRKKFTHKNFIII